jgi:TetR/AcrR family transcriptional repressor of nem operon
VPRVSDAKEKLLDSAVKLVFTNSYEGVGIDDICRDAGVKKGSFYYFFESKKDLVIGSLERFFESQVRRMLLDVFSADATPEEKIERYFLAIYDFQKALKKGGGRVCGCHFGNVAIEMSTQDEAMRSAISRLLSEIARCIEAALLGPKGGLAPGRASLCSQQVLAYMEGTVLLAKVDNDPERIRTLSSGAVALVAAARA